ncbi:STN domain-containing protein [Spirosoma areae]
MTAFRQYFFLVFFPILANAQPTPPLERLISVDFRNERLQTVLSRISRDGNFSFSYNPALLNQAQSVTLRATNRPVRDVLGQLFGSSIRLKMRGNHVILLRGEKPTEPARSFLLDGYIINGQTGERVADVSVFEQRSLRSAVSSQYGYYRLKLPTDVSAVRLEVRRRLFFSQSLTVQARQSQPVNVYLTPMPLQTPLNPLTPRATPTDTTTRPIPSLPEPVALLAWANVDSTERRLPLTLAERSRNTLARWSLSAKQLIHSINLDRDTLYRTWQVSFVPYVGTNHALSGRIINDYSINALVGYSLGVRKFEAGGLLNIVRGNVQGIQLAGFGNLVGEQTKGIQLAGFINTNRGDVGPVQAAGFVNVVGGNVAGFQAAGFLNADRKDVRGFQAAGFANTVGGTVEGFQAAGFTNIVGGDMRGVQAAGFMNGVRGKLTGWQISGFLNYARTVTGGHQISIINWTDSTDRTPFGLFSFVRKNGYRNIEISTNEVNTFNATFRTGVRSFYNIVTAGVNPASRIWSFGYGLGTVTAERRGWSFGLEGTAHQLNRTGEGIQDQNLLLRLSPIVNKRFGSHFSASLGPSINAYYAGDQSRDPLVNLSLPALVLSRDELIGTSPDALSTWLGWQVGLQYKL